MKSLLHPLTKYVRSIANNDTYTVEIWGFHGKDFMQLYTGKPLQRSNREYDIWFGIYSDKEDYFLAQHSGDMAENVSILKLSGDTFKEKTTCEYDESTISYIMNKKNVTDDFERVRFAVLRESTAEKTRSMRINNRCQKA